MKGPIDFFLIGFEGNKFEGKILKELEKVLEEKIINLVALSIISKDDEGNMTTLKVEDIDDEYFVEFVEKYPPNRDLIAKEDLTEISDLVEDNTTVALLVIEHTWAKPIKKAILDANGVLVADGRIHPEAANEIENREEKDIWVY